MISTAAIPGHVPQSVVVDFDIFSPPILRRACTKRGSRCIAPTRSSVLWTPRNGGHWIVNSGQLVPQFYRDFKHFSSRNELRGCRYSRELALHRSERTTEARPHFRAFRPQTELIIRGGVMCRMQRSFSFSDWPCAVGARFCGGERSAR